MNNIIHKLTHESLYSNSVYLMMSTFIMGISGLFFWALCSRLFSTEQIGLATALISVTALVTGISMFGFNIGIIRFLPNAKDQNALLNTSFTIIAAISLVVATGYLLGIDHFSPALAFIQENMLYSVGFVIVMLLSTINMASDSIFIAKRESKIILIYNSLSSFTKLLLPLLFVGIGAMGIYMSVVGGTLMALLLTIVFLYKRYQYMYRPAVQMAAAKHILNFSFKNFVSNFINGLPLMIMPLLVLNKMGTEQSAYYYIAMMLASMIYIIPSSITRSFFAEGVHREAEIRLLIAKAAKMIFICLIPPIICIVLFGKYILLAFGKDFSTEAFTLLVLLSLTALFIAINSIGSSIMYIKDRMKIITVLSVINAVLILVPLLILPAISLVTIGTVWVSVHAFIALITVIIIKTLYRVKS